MKAGSHPDDPYILFTPDGWVEKAFIHLRDGDGKAFTLIVKTADRGHLSFGKERVEER